MVQAAGADPTDTMTRGQIKDHVIAMAERHVAACESYSSLKTDASKNLAVWIGDEQGAYLTVCTMDAPGLTVDDFKAFYHPDSLCDNMKILDKIITARKIENVGGELDANMYTIYQHVKTPMIASNRCCFMCVHNIDMPDGSFVHMSTSKGNKALEEANVALKAKDVLSHCWMTYNKIEAKADGSGCRITTVICVDASGSLPGMIKK